MRKILIGIFMFMILSGFIIAAPSLPHTFIGTVEFTGDSEMSLTGHDISAKVGIWNLGVIGTVQSGNTYDVLVDPQGRFGTLTFFIGGVEAEETKLYIWGGHTEDFTLTINELPQFALCGNGIQEPGEQCDVLDIGVGTCENVLGILDSTGNLSCTNSCTFDFSICTAPSCGDNICNGAETCSTCSNDCGVCAVASTTSSGGGGGGGGSSGGGGGSSGGGGGGSSSSVTFLADSTETEEEKTEESESKVQEETKIEGIFFLNFLTGAVTGFVSTGTGIASLFFIVLIIAGVGIVIFLRRGSLTKD